MIFRLLQKKIYVFKAYILSPNEVGIFKSATFYLLSADGLRFWKRDFLVKFIILRLWNKKRKKNYRQEGM